MARRLESRGIDTTLLMRILIIDDDLFSVQLLQGILHKSGYENVRTVTSLREGLALMRKESLDLIIADFFMPDVVIGLCSALKENPATCDIPLFIITGASIDSDALMEQAFKCGVTEWMVKPIHASDFLVRLRGALRSKQLIDQLRQEIQRRSSAEKKQQKLIFELQIALENIKKLKGLLPICSTCKKIHNDHGYWKSVEKCIQEKYGPQFMYNICTECAQKLFPQFSARSSDADTLFG